MARKRKRNVTLAAAVGFDGKMALAVDTVPDPFEPAKRINVARNVVAPVEMMRKRKELDGSEVAACEKFRAIYDAARIGGARAIDYTKEPVDGGRIAQPLSVKAMAANAELAKIARVPGVGKDGFTLLVRIIGEERGLTSVAQQWAGSSGDARRVAGYVRLRFLEAVRALVSFWGATATGKRSPILASDETVTGPTTEWMVGRFGEMEPIR